LRLGGSRADNDQGQASHDRGDLLFVHCLHGNALQLSEIKHAGKLSEKLRPHYTTRIKVRTIPLENTVRNVELIA
jgi:hypothetical protein